ncbi:MAG: hypothetical protein IPJ28_13935 [Betaproteobacteria bacterium]|nr:hypothetical protein [Betaproteobacteria bacterium]
MWNTLYFSANDGTTGIELWKSDGTIAGTVLVSDLTAGAGSTAFGEAVAYGGQLLFVATTAASGSELWKSDGTAAGTVLVKDITPGATGSTPSSLTVSGDKLFLVASDATTGREPWVSDGTTAGTVRLKDIHPSAGSFPAGFIPANGVAYFTADDGTNGREIWRTDGTEAGTTLLAQTVAGAGSDTPGLAVLAGGLLYLQATSASLGTELHAIPVGVPDAVTIAPIGGVTTNPVDFAPITITGIDHPVPISIEEDPLEPGSNPVYSVGCTGTFTDSPGLVANGQSVCVRHTQFVPFSPVVVYTQTTLVAGARRIAAISSSPFPVTLGCTGTSSLTSFGQVHSNPLVCTFGGPNSSVQVFPVPRFASLVYDATRVRPYEWLGACAALAGSATSCPFTPPASIGHAFSYPTIVTVTANGPGALDLPPADIGVSPILRYFPTPRYQAGLLLNPVRTLTFTATPGSGAVVASLTLANCTPQMNCACDAGTGVCTSRVIGDSNIDRFVTLTARFGYELAVGRSGAGSGSVNAASNFTTGDCAGACTQAYPGGTVVTLTASPVAGSVFAGWSGEGCTGTGACVVTVDAAKNVTAAFALQAFSITVGKAGDGGGTVTSSPAGIDCGSTCAAGFDFGTVVTLTATPSPGSIFVGWSGACSALLPCNVTADAAKSVTASFAAVPFTLSVTKSGSGSGSVTSSPAGIDCGATCSTNFNGGTVVVLTGTASSGSVFAGWSGGGCSGTGACNVTIDAAKTITATFDLQQFALTVTKSGAGTGTVTSTPAGIACGATCSANFNSGVSVALAAAPTADSFFAGWSGACTGTGACNVTMDAAKGVGAQFKLNTAIPRMANISTRMQVLTGNDVLIGGFIIGGSAPKTVVVRARGPSLIPFGIANALPNPTMQLFSGQTVLATSDDWGTAANAAAITTSGFAPSSPLESAILTTLGPGAYTAVVSGVGGVTGVGIIEVFEVDRPEVPLANISTRGQVLTGNDVMIGGFVIQGDTPQTVVVRARGPSLVPFGITNALMDPVLQLFNGATPIATNDDWQFQTVPGDVAAIQASGFAPADTREAVIRITLPPGAYTAIVSGKNGGTGVGIIEAFAQ